jgi:hypothetical protein
MNPNDTPTSPEPPIPISPEDNAALQAIEALEARSVDPNPGPLNLDVLTQKPMTKQDIAKPAAPVSVTLTPAQVIQPTKPTVTVVPKPKPVVIPAVPATPVPAPIKEVQKSAPVPEKPKVPKTPAEEMADELANVPATRPSFQFFMRQKASRKQIMIAVTVVIVIILGVSGYLGLKALQ